MNRCVICLLGGALRVLPLRHSPSGIDVDVSLGNLPFEREAVARATKVRIGDLRVPLATIEDLIILKAIAHRERDLADVADLLELHPDVDTHHIRRQLDEFAQLLEMPEIYVDLDRLLVKSSKKKRRRK